MREKELTERVRRELERGERDHCFVGEWEINKLWPDLYGRQAKLRRFAHRHGFLLRGYEKGLGAVFVKAFP